MKWQVKNFCGLGYLFAECFFFYLSNLNLSHYQCFPPASPCSLWWSAAEPAFLILVCNSDSAVPFGDITTQHDTFLSFLFSFPAVARFWSRSFCPDSHRSGQCSGDCRPLRRCYRGRESSEPSNALLTSGFSVGCSWCFYWSPFCSRSRSRRLWTIPRFLYEHVLSR